MRLKAGHATVCIAAGLVLMGLACAPHGMTASGPLIPLPSMAATQPTNLAGVQNIVAYSPKLYSGAVPEGEEGFKTLRAMGIQTIISVDGMQPDVEGAEAQGMRYVHLPIGYNGMDKARTLELARAVRDLPGPIYLHCHHGKHRSAAAAAAVEVTLGEMTPDQGIAHMKTAGTAPAYMGLFKCVAAAEPASRQELDTASDVFPASYKTGSIVQTMVAIDEGSDRLQILEKSGWKSPANHPDLVPVAEAGRLSDLFRQVTQDPAPLCRSPEFQGRLTRASEDAISLETTLAQPTIDPALASAKLKTITHSCTACHEKFRN